MNRSVYDSRDARQADAHTARPTGTLTRSVPDM
jgi:hypothetical protein